MNRVLNRAVAVAGLVFTLGGTSSWGGPPNNDVSDWYWNTAGGTEALYSNSTGSYNTAFGGRALRFNTFGSDNTASGYEALYFNTTGGQNTASGFSALRSNFTGRANTASGANALQSNTVGHYNTASGAYALYYNTSGIWNTAIGVNTLFYNGIGIWNTAIGVNALYSNSTGNYNAASGTDALYSNVGGSWNTASGISALRSNTAGNFNAAYGIHALYRNTTGGSNTALGPDALYNSTTGSYNIAVGSGAGAALQSGSGNIYLGHRGVTTESNTMHLGQSQTRTFIAGIFGNAASGGSQVFINSQGQLGTVLSSARYKRDIQDMGEESRGLRKLRPVTFRYKDDAEGQRQYGLIAEEVAKVYPELVVWGVNGEIESVQYHVLIPMLINEVQHQQRKLDVQTQQLAELKAQNERFQTALVEQQVAVAARLERLEESARAATLVSR